MLFRSDLEAYIGPLEAIGLRVAVTVPLAILVGGVALMAQRARRSTA